MTPGARTIAGGCPPPHDQEALDHVLRELPDHDPYHARAFVDLRDPGSGAVHELDLIVVGGAALYVLDLRCEAGCIDGDDLLWRWNHDSSARTLENPLRALRGKARALAARLEAAMRRQGGLRPDERLPPVQPLVFLGAAALDLRLTPAGRSCVVTREEVGAALRRHVFPGVSDDPAPDRITSIRGDALRAGLDAIGLRPRRERSQIGAYVLGPALAAGGGHQDHEAAHRDRPATRLRARTYLVPEQADQTARLALRRLADRDANLLFGVREHAGVLTLHDYHADSPLGPTLLLDGFEGGVSLREFLEHRPDLTFADRMAILEQVALALAYCHRRVVYHGSLGPDAVLVRQPDPERPPEARLFDFQIGRSPDSSPTVHRSRFASEPCAAYQAPELFTAPDAIGPETDLFSLGALGYLLVTGRPPAPGGAELQRRLAREGALDPRSVSDVVPDRVADAIVEATRLSRCARGTAERGADVGAWIEAIRAGLSPAPRATEFVPPLHARPGDRLRDDLEVVSVLGRGASACVLEVRRDDQSYALKVSLGPDQDARLRGEARTLQRIRHARVVQLHETLVLADRQCLLLSLAGTRTLQQALDRHGSIDLDLSLRYGDDLLGALEHLEAARIAHRDIKPANIGEGSLAKQSKRITLFDFSLADVDEAQIDVGTEPYRDPFLPLRGRFDAAADRWGAAVVLHEMLTGVRPEWRPRGTSPLAPDAALAIARERFDAAARDRLTAFFTTAFARELPVRFASATAMRAAWAAIVEVPTAVGAEAPPDDADARRQVLAGLADDAPLDALPLGVRARNALDRAGLTRARDLLALPDNRLSAIRGAGRVVAREIDELRRLWIDMGASASAPAFFPGYRGHDLDLDAAGLPPAVALALTDAGLDRLTAVATAPEDHLHTLARRHAFSVEAVRAVLCDHHGRADAHPTTSQAWLDALLPRSAGVVHRWLGLAEGRPERPPPGPRELAAAADVPAARVARDLADARRHGQQHPALPQLHALVAEALDDLGGAAPLPRAAEATCARLGEPADDADARSRAAALVRWLAELRPDVHVVRLDDRDDAPLWVVRDADHAGLVRQLGARADELARRDVLAAPAEAEAELRKLVRGTALAALPQVRLLDISAQASHRAAVSSRQELYPRGLSADRAILHAASALAGDLTPTELAQRVRGRYPESAAIPPRPQLDALLAPLGLHWAGTCYRRRSPDTRSSLHTLSRAAARRPTAHPGQRTARTPEAEASRDFEAHLERTLRTRESLLLKVDPPDADRAAVELSRVVRSPAVLLDRRLIATIEALARDYAIDRAVLHETDRAGEASPEWPNLLRLAAEAADRLADELFPNAAPLLLARPGLLARFHLDAWLHRAVQNTRDDRAASLLFLVPCGSRVPAIENTLPIPGLAASQRIAIPRAWLLNDGRRAASDHPYS